MDAITVQKMGYIARNIPLNNFQGWQKEIMPGFYPLTASNELMGDFAGVPCVWKVPVKIKKLRANAKIPKYQTDGAAGADLYFAPADGMPVTLKAGKRAVLALGFAVEIPFGYEIQVRGRSGLARVNGVTVFNAPGTVDSDYRGEMGVQLINVSDADITFNDGDRIAQMVLNEVPIAEFEEVDDLSSTNRGEGGYGSTGRR